MDERARQPNAIMSYNERWPSKVIRKLAIITPIHHRPRRLLERAAVELARLLSWRGAQ